MRKFYKLLLKDVVALSLNRFKDNLEEHSEVGDLLVKKGIDETTQEQFQVGYASPDWTSLTQFLTDEKYYFRDCARTLGLVENGQRGLHDSFRDRVVVPVLDRSGDPVGFTSRSVRSLKEEYQPKRFDRTVLNSIHSPIFDKEKQLVGYHSSLEGIRRREEVVVTLDPLELLAMHSGGSSNAVMELIPGGFDSPKPSSQHQLIMDQVDSLNVLSSSMNTGRNSQL